MFIGTAASQREVIATPQAREVIALTTVHVDDRNEQHDSVVHTLLQMPLNYLGMTVRIHALEDGEPPPIDARKTRAVLIHLQDDGEALPAWVWPWLERQRAIKGLRFVHMGALTPLLQKNPRRLRTWLDSFGLYTSGKPIANAHLTATQVVGAPRALSDADGHVQLEVDWPAQLTEGNRHFLVVAASGDGLTRLTRQLPVTKEKEQTFALGDLVLELGGAISGTAFDADRSPLPNARIWVAHAEEPAQGVTEERRLVFGRGFVGLGQGVWSWATTDQQGRYRITGLPIHSVSVVARRFGWLSAYTPPVQLIAGQEVQAPTLTLGRVPAKNLIAGWVRGEDGKPLPGAQISVFPNRGARNIDPQTSTVAAPPDGAFEAVVMSNEKYTLEVEQDGRKRKQTVVHDIAAGTKDVIVQFVRGREFELVVTGPGGVTVEAPTASASDERGNGLRLGSKPDRNGVLQLAAPSQKFTLWIRASGYLSTSLGPFEPAAVPKRLEVELKSVGVVTGRVIANGQPVVGAAVHLHFINARSRFHYFAHNVFTRLEAAWRSDVKTDAAGQFELQVRRNGLYVVHASADGHARGESGEVELVPGVPAAPLEISLTKPAAIEGHVLTGSNTNAAGQIIAATRGDGHVEVCVSDSEGRFHFEGLTPGGWQVRACRPDDQRWLQRARTWPDRSITELPVDVQIFALETAKFDVDLRSRESAEIRGRLAIDGVNCSGWKVSLWRDGEYLFTKTDANGEFTQRGAVGKTTIYFFGHLPAGGQLQVKQALTLVDGVNALVVSIETGGVDLLSLPPPVKPPEEARPEGYALVWPGALENAPTFVYRFDPDVAGNHRVAALPVGLAQLRRRENDRTDVESWKPIADVTLATGQHPQVTPR